MLNNYRLLHIMVATIVCMLLYTGAPAALADDDHREDGIALEEVTSEEIIFIEDEYEEEMIESAPVADAVDEFVASTNDPIIRCREETYTQGALLHCLENNMKDAEAVYKRASETAQRRAHDIQDAQENRKAVRAFSSSSLAFESFRESECHRQKSLVPDEMESHFTYMACVASLYNMQAQTLANP